MIDLRAVSVAVGFAREVLSSRWADHAWRLVGVAPAGEVPAGAELVRDALELRLHGDEADHYLLNLTAPEPMLFVVWRLQDGLPSVMMLTVSYGEAARMLDAGENVEGVPLPADLAGWVEDFARRHYRPPEKKQKNKRYANTREESQS